ncbi:SDR family oxidoreductase [Fluviispira multicolorata]|uniref:NAD-dependent epimerase/dehydratase family protein n=1 Tax=Fluviispira multicolorata TaxID=2654512 RepID=A0A833N5J2_9BACT|nr:SDR family oxidoreductase [Fluviispira multicolorata]KAB8028016.1 NAD-dependent epimerase/dehydratase family protein [Fluviispira multicolorata]
MKIVVTGALGHIGSRLIRELPKHFDFLEVIIIDDLSTQRFASLFNLPKNVHYRMIEGKVQNIELDKIILGAKCLIHLAATTDASGTADKPEMVHKNNLESTRAVANACLKNNIPIIYPSTTSVYGSQSSLVDEECTELFPQSPYAECKISEENLLKDLFNIGLRGIICRFGTIYGTSPGMRFHTAVNKFCWQAVLGQPITVWETAFHQKRPYLDLKDAVNSFIWIIKNELYNGYIMNVATYNHTVNEVVDAIQKNILNIQIEYVQHKIMNQLSYEVSSTRFLNTGFSFTGKLEIGILDTISLLKNTISKF